MRSDRTRPASDFGQGGSAFELIRLRGVNADTLQNRRLKWVRSDSGGSYSPSTEEIEFFEPNSSTPKQLAADAEAWVIFRQAANRYEEVASSGGVMTVILTASIAAASWNSGTVKLTPAEDDVYAFEWLPHVDNDGTYTYDNAEPVHVENWFTSAITVTSGKGKIAQVLNGRIFNVDCVEITLE